ncbi:penicillin-binding transpeptidase domain-containing protein [Tropicibacter naphthalenivorans]|uniref:Penicillin-binding protein 2 n=1 Tax=Tropicibacter naphthalenivorans TaxID=441103 RepID=A0A0P1GK67_9RHOB|nr:penicillin-binding transpeptidase domain-containing protein [Tropicibacter naphthalenivorans]CUH82366.1 penicillin-binding protein 2 [Tropicibacter naphthalenivorans]SMD05367.1 Penicillin binding protein transpeptidase domain-containing protein [Tropicibacter naphthalenivorans]
MLFVTGLLSAAMLAAVGVLIAPLFFNLEDITQRNKAWIDTASVRASNSVSTQLFLSGARHGYIYYDPAEDQVKLRTPREITFGLAREVPGVTEPEDGFLPPDITQKLLWRNTGAGVEIRKELARHQVRRSIIGVRDARISRRCQSADRTAGICSGTPWLITPRDLAPSSGAASQAAGADDIDPTIFSGFARRTGPFPGDWSAISGADVRNSSFEMRPLRLQLGRSGTAVVDIIGSAPALEPAGAHPNARFQPLCLSDSEALVRLRVTPCADLGKDADQAIAYRLQMPAGEWTADSRLIAQSVQVPSLPGELRDRLSKGQAPSRAGTTAPFRRRIDDRFNLACMGRACWPELVLNRQVRRVAIDLVEAEQLRNAPAAGQSPAPDPADPDTPAPAVRLGVNDPFLANTDTGGVALSEAAHQLNLEPMIGIPGLSNGSYMNFLENLPAGVTRDQLRLTFDPALQEVALRQTRSLLETRDFPVQTNVVRATFDEDRKAGFVMIDLQDNPGAVRAAVSYPFFNPDMPIWDLQALATGAEGNSPASPSVWRGLDARLQPGSSMKIVSSLSLIRSAIGLNEAIPEEHQPLIAQAVFGAKPATYRNQIGFSIERADTTVSASRTNVAPPFTFADRGEVPFTTAARTACQSQGLAAEKAASGRNYGICEALARSSNIFFGQMAVYESENAIEALYDADVQPRVFTGLGQTLRDMGLNGALPLVALPPEVAAEASFVPRMEPPTLASTPGLRGSGGPIAGFDFHERNVAINAYGQNAFASPLTMATAAGDIALNTRLVPHIAHPVGFAPAPQGPLLPDTPVAQAMMSELHLGMKAVMQSGGTGARSFGSSSGAAKAIQPRVHGKTGTATMGIADGNGRNLNTHWFVGWVDDVAGKPRYAFACAISHTSGGSPCPALTGGILGALAEAGQL